MGLQVGAFIACPASVEHPIRAAWELPCPLDIVIIAHSERFVKGFSKLFSSFFSRPAERPPCRSAPIAS